MSEQQDEIDPTREIVLDPLDVAAELGAIDAAAVPSVERSDGQPGMIEQLAGADIADIPEGEFIRPPVREVLRTPPPGRPGATMDPAALAALTGSSEAGAATPAAEVEWELGPDSPQRTSEAVLAEANNVIHGDRPAAYGPAEDSFARIGALWSVHLGIKVDAYDVAILMVLMKAARAKTDLKQDTFVDMAGYAALAPRCAVAAGR